jgi:hypothetical protein
MNIFETSRAYSFGLMLAVAGILTSLLPVRAPGRRGRLLVYLALMLMAALLLGNIGSRAQVQAWAPGDAGLKQPLLILQGERDYNVTMDAFHDWQHALAKRANVSFKSYRNSITSSSKAQVRRATPTMRARATFPSTLWMRSPRGS